MLESSDGPEHFFILVLITFAVPAIIFIIALIALFVLISKIMKSRRNRIRTQDTKEKD